VAAGRLPTWLGAGAFILLTVLTQVGGLALIPCWLVARTPLVRGLPSAMRGGLLLLVFLAGYSALTRLLVPSLAALGGRVPLPCRADAARSFAAGHPLYCVLNRHYVDARVVPVLSQMSRDVATTHPGTITLFLDANFPFLDGFPLLPHLSHNDGRKLDLAFYYAAADGTYLPGTLRSPIGYWGFEDPAADDPSPCRPNQWLTLRWDMALLQRFWPERPLEPERTRAALNWLVTEGARHGVERVFVEPHLARRLGVSSPLLRFQGCRAARHDDHIHFQIRR
jgi:hypothetical protein